MTTFVRERRRADARPRGRSGRRRTAMGGVMAVALLALAACTSTTTPNPGSGASAGGANPAATDSTISTGTGLIPPDADGDSTTDATGETAAPAAPSGPPDAALLTWLDGAATQDGVVTGSAGERWVGRAAGEYATLGDGWYRYFGPDGSLVGCTSAGACVSVGADGTVAVTHAPGGPRDVYRSDGQLLGRYDSDGEKVGSTADVADFVAALAGTGVDLIGLLDAASRGAPFAGGVTGDPHVITLDGQRYTTQVTGQFEARTGDPHHRIQLQLSPMSHRDDVSTVSLVAVGTGNDAILFDASGAVTIDGDRQPVAQDFTQKDLSDDDTLGYWPADDANPATLAVVWADGGTVTATAHGALGITVVAHLHPVADAAGLFGTSALGGGPDLVARSGAAAGSVDSAVRSWRVSQADRLLPPSTASQSRPGPKPVEVDPSARKVASRLCSATAMTQSQDVAACAFDVAVTGDTGFISGHVALAVAAQSADVPPSFAQRWPALEVGRPSAATDLPAAGRIAVSLAPAGARLYQLTTDASGPVRLVSENACAAEATAAMDKPAWRLFDDGDRPISERFPLCGDAATGAVPAGSYLLAIANGVGEPPLQVRATVTAP